MKHSLNAVKEALKIDSESSFNGMEQDCFSIIEGIQKKDQIINQLSTFVQDIHNSLSTGSIVKNLIKNQEVVTEEYLAALQSKITTVMLHYKKLCEESQLIIDKAVSEGFDQTFSVPSSPSKNQIQYISVYKAHEFILDNELKNEQQQHLMDNHKSLTELRQTTEKEREITESQKQKSKKVIQQLRKTISEIKESETLIHQKLLDEKQKRKLLESELIQQKEINKSLNSLINNDNI